MKKRKEYEYELCITYLDTNKRGIRVRNIGLNSNASFSPGSGLGFCDLGFCNIRSKGTNGTKVAPMPTQENVMMV